MDNSENSPRSLPVGKIITGFNYRRRFNAEAMASLEADIKARGVDSPVLVRLLDDGNYQLIAGGRRVKAFTNAFGPEAEIPVNVKIMTDAEATAAMVAENKERENTTAIEDAEAAARMLGICKGDKEEAARRLNWKVPQLDRRLALMNAVQSVRDAYLEEKIELGHLELLAALRAEVQEHLLKIINEAEKKPTVAEFKAMAEQALLSLEAAIFDKAACATCQYNSAIQQSMFETSFKGSHCSNNECFDNKTNGELEARADKLRETYQVVRIVRAGENMTLFPVRAEGKRSVGAEQAQACRTCKDFGACVSGVPAKLGVTFENICFNKECNDEKVAAHEKVLAEAQSQVAQAAAAAANVSQETGEAKGASEAGGEDVKSTPAPSKTVTKTVVTNPEPRNAVKEYRESAWRVIYAHAVRRLPVLESRALLVALCMYRPSTFDTNAAAKAIGERIGVGDIKSHDIKGLLKTTMHFTQDNLGKAMQGIPSFLSSSMEIRSITTMMDVLDIKIEDYFSINQAFLDVLTKNEIDAVCVELGLDEAIGKEYQKTKNGSKADFIKAILALKNRDGQEDWLKGKVPALMRW